MSLRYRRLIFPVAAVGVTLVLASTLSPVLSPVLFAMLLAVVLNPVVEAAGRFQLPRVATVSILYVVFVLFGIVVAAGVGGQVQLLGTALVGEPFHGDLDGNGLIELDVRDENTGELLDEFEDRDGNAQWDGGALFRFKSWVDQARGRLAGGVWGTAVEELGNNLLDLLEKVAVPATAMLGKGLERVARWAGL